MHTEKRKAPPVLLTVRLVNLSSAFAYSFNHFSYWVGTVSDLFKIPEKICRGLSYADQSGTINLVSQPSRPRELPTSSSPTYDLSQNPELARELEGSLLGLNIQEGVERVSRLLTFDSQDEDREEGEGQKWRYPCRRPSLRLTTSLG